VLTRPEVFINLANAKFDADGKLTDATTRKILGDQMLAFERWIERMTRA
jgi:chromate reductase